MPFDVNCTLLFTELPFLERPAAAKAAGFDAIEAWWPWSVAAPPDRAVDAFVAAVRDAGVRLVGLNFFGGDLASGDRGLFSWPERSTELADTIAVAADIGARLGCRSFNALYGNRSDEHSADELDELALANLATAAGAVDPFGGRVMVEAVSGAPRYPLKLAADAVAVIDRARERGVENIGFLADLYHLATNGDDPARVIAEHGDSITHVQIADVPGRHEPGTGDLDIDGLLTQLQAARYTGWAGLEYHPTTSTDASLAWLPHARRAGR